MSVLPKEASEPEEPLDLIESRMAPQPGGHDEAKSEGLAMTPELAEYIADLLAELRDIAHATGTSNLENILEIARREAADPMVQRQRTGQD